MRFLQKKKPSHETDQTKAVQRFERFSRALGLTLRRRPLYPTELRVQGLEKYKLQRHFCQIKIAENGSLTIF